MVAEIVEDWTVYPTMVKLAACLCLEMEAAGFKDMCFCGIVPGAETVLDFCGNEDGTGCEGSCGGMAWVRLITAFPTTDLLNPADAATCAMSIAFQLEVGHAQCAPMPDDDGTPPNMAEQLDATRRQVAAMSAMRRAIVCCLGDSETVDHLLGPYTPLPILGGCLAAVWSVTVSQPHG